eukprot:COSAG04_NODE_24009_length_328_cov_1.122271_1_plen_28_part_01
MGGLLLAALPGAVGVCSQQRSASDDRVA